MVSSLTGTQWEERVGERYIGGHVAQYRQESTMWQSTGKKVQCGRVPARKYNMAHYRQESTMWHSTGKEVQCGTVPARKYNLAQYRQDTYNVTEYRQESTMWQSTGKKVFSVCRYHGRNGYGKRSLNYMHFHERIYSISYLTKHYTSGFGENMVLSLYV
jgi:hypothetical protein